MLKEKFLKIIQDKSEVKIEIGPGKISKPEYIGIDIVDLEGVDIVCDIENGLPFIPDSCVDSYYSNHVLEHISNYENLIKEIHRTLKADGKAEMIVPHFTNSYFYSDYTHKRTFGLFSFDYFCDEKYQLHTKVPNFYTNIRFKILKRELRFGSKFLLFHWILQIFKKLVNLNPFMQEFYEVSWSNYIRCNEVRFIISPDK